MMAQSMPLPRTSAAQWPVKADHQAIADQHIVANAFDIHQVLDPGEGKYGHGGGGERDPEGKSDDTYIKWCAHGFGFCL